MIGPDKSGIYREKSGVTVFPSRRQGFPSRRPGYLSRYPCFSSRRPARGFRLQSESPSRCPAFRVTIWNFGLSESRSPSGLSDSPFGLSESPSGLSGSESTSNPSRRPGYPSRRPGRYPSHRPGFPSRRPGSPSPALRGRPRPLPTGPPPGPLQVTSPVSESAGGVGTLCSVCIVLTGREACTIPLLHLSHQCRSARAGPGWNRAGWTRAEWTRPGWTRAGWTRAGWTRAGPGTTGWHNTPHALGADGGGRDPPSRQTTPVYYARFKFRQPAMQLCFCAASCSRLLKRAASGRIQKLFAG
jgi:hypothetical protein